MKHLIKNFEVKFNSADEETGVIEGYASTFGNIDFGMDIVAKGAFKKSIKDKKGVFPILADHDWSKQIGWNVEASEDETGLLVKGELDIKVNQAAREKFSLAKKALDLKTKSGLSIGFRVIKDSWDRDKGIRTIKEAQLLEYSLVTFPMNDEATITATKNAMIEAQGVNELTKNFIDRLMLCGYSKNEIQKALERAADIETDPLALDGQSSKDIADIVTRLERAVRGS